MLYGPEYGDSTLHGSSSQIPLSISFPYFGNNERDLYVSHSKQNCIMYLLYIYKYTKMLALGLEINDGIFNVKFVFNS